MDDHELFSEETGAELEEERGRMRPYSPRFRAGRSSLQRRSPGASPPPRRRPLPDPRPRSVYRGGPYGYPYSVVVGAPTATEPPLSVSGHAQCVQDCLNRLSASGPPQSSDAPYAEPPGEEPAEQGEVRIADSGFDSSRIVNLAPQADRARVRGQRNPATVSAVVLRRLQGRVPPGAPLDRMLTVNAHFVVLGDGRALRLHPVSAVLHAAGGFDRKSVIVAFALDGAPTAAQVTTGRDLIRKLRDRHDIRHVFALRQAHATHENDPGPQVWAQVGQWAVDTLRLTDGGASFRINSGQPIPSDWRTSTNLNRGGNTMHATSCGCQRCRPLSEEQEMELALELLNVSSEAELEQFLGKIWKGIKKVGSAVGKFAKPFAGVLKAVAKKALPFVGGALGSFIPIPGVGTALGSALGSAVSSALELEMEGVSLEDREFEMARRFVRIASTAAQRVAQAPPNQSPEAAMRSAVIEATRAHVPGADLSRFGVPAAAAGQGGSTSGRWVRQGGQITLLGL